MQLERSGGTIGVLSKFDLTMQRHEKVAFRVPDSAVVRRSNRFSVTPLAGTKHTL